MICCPEADRGRNPAALGGVQSVESWEGGTRREAEAQMSKAERAAIIAATARWEIPETEGGSDKQGTAKKGRRPPTRGGSSAPQQKHAPLHARLPTRASEYYSSPVGGTWCGACGAPNWRGRRSRPSQGSLLATLGLPVGQVGRQVLGRVVPAHHAVPHRAMKKIALREHREEILKYFRAKKTISSRTLEGLNNRDKIT
jgi:hypothetical protein